MGKLLDGIRYEAGFLEFGLTLAAGSDVRLERGNAKTLLVIEEEVDLCREEVTMIHGEVYAARGEWVSE
jgi:hypothetical protein